MARFSDKMRGQLLDADIATRLLEGQVLAERWRRYWEPDEVAGLSGLPNTAAGGGLVWQKAS